MNVPRATYHIIIASDYDDDLVYTLITPGPLLEELLASGFVAHWQFSYRSKQTGECLVHLYYPLSPTMPRGENLEEINWRVMRAIEAQTGL